MNPIRDASCAEYSLILDKRPWYFTCNSGTGKHNTRLILLAHNTWVEPLCIHGILQDSCNSSVLAMEILQSCTERSISKCLAYNIAWFTKAPVCYMQYQVILNRAVRILNCFCYHFEIVNLLKFVACRSRKRYIIFLYMHMHVQTAWIYEWNGSLWIFVQTVSHLYFCWFQAWCWLLYWTFQR